jgi:hypothetical protein
MYYGIGKIVRRVRNVYLGWRLHLLLPSSLSILPSRPGRIGNRIFPLRHSGNIRDISVALPDAPVAFPGPRRRPLERVVVVVARLVVAVGAGDVVRLVDALRAVPGQRLRA